MSEPRESFFPEIIHRYLPLTLLAWPPLVRGAAKGEERLLLLVHGLVLLCVFSAAGIFRKNEKFFFPRHAVIPAILMVLAMVSTFASVYPRGSYEIAGILVLYFFIYLWAASIRDGETINIHITVITCVAAAVAAAGLWRYWAGVDTVWGKPAYALYDGRATGTYMNPNHAACLWAMALPFTILWVLKLRGALKIFGIAAAGVVATALVLSFSRGGFLAAGTGIAVLAATAGLGAGKMSPKAKAALLLAVAAAGCLGVWKLSSLRRHPRQHVLEVSTPWRPGEGDAGFETRRMILRDTVKMVADRPVFGSGPGTYDFVYPAYRGDGIYELANAAHNDYAQNASEYGVPYAILFMIFIVMSCLPAFRALKEREAGARERAAFTLSAVAGFCAFMLVDFNLRIPANGLMFFYLLGACAGMGGEERKGIAAGAGPAKAVLAAVAVVSLAAMIPLSEWISALGTYDSSIKLVAGGQIEKAADYAMKAAETDPGNYYFRMNAADTCFKKAAKLKNRKELKLAEKTALEAAKMTEFEGRGLVVAARVEAGLKNREAAEKYLLEALKIEPKNAGYMDNLVLYLILWGRKEEALGWVEKSCRALPRRYMHFYIRDGKWDPEIYAAAARGFAAAWRELDDFEAIAALMMLAREAMRNQDCALPRMVYDKFGGLINPPLAERIEKRCGN